MTDTITVQSRNRVAVAVIGAGAIGGIVAAHLARTGMNVQLVTKHPAWADLISKRGLFVTGVNGAFTAVVPSVASVSALTGPKDIVFHATKATDMIEAVTDLIPFLHAKSAVVSLQNGLCEDALAAVVGRHRVLGCVVGWGATMLAPAHIEMTSGGEFVIGSLEGNTDTRLPVVRELLSEIVPVEVSSNIRGALYSKLIINACITSLGAVSGLLLGEMLSRRPSRHLFIEIIREATSVARAMDLVVEPYAGKLDYERFLHGDNFTHTIRRHLTVRLIGFKYRRLKSSALQSLERGKQTEIDYLNGYIADQGRRLGVPTPINDEITRMIKEIEGKERPITPANLDELSRIMQ